MSSIKRDVKEKSSASTGVEICFSAPSPLSIGYAAMRFGFRFSWVSMLAGGDAIELRERQVSGG
jgi:hypothetical protein